MDYVLPTGRRGGPGEGAHGEDEGVLGAEGVDARRRVVVEQACAQAVAANVLPAIGLVYLLDRALSIAQVHVKDLACVTIHLDASHSSCCRMICGFL